MMQVEDWIGAAAPSRVSCPSRVSAFEKAVRGYADNQTENVITPTLGTSFDSLTRRAISTTCILG